MTTATVLLGGAGLGPWVWEGVLERLRGAALAPEYPRVARSTLADYAESVRQAVDDAGYDDVVLVGHSISGLVAIETCRLLGDRVRGLLAVAASIPERQGSHLSSIPFPQRMATSIVMRVAGTRPPESVLRHGYAHDLDEATTKRVIERFEPETLHLYSSRLSPWTPPPHTGYVFTTDDHELPLALQELSAQRLDASFRVALASGHLPMLSRPSELALAIAEFASPLLAGSESEDVESL